MSDRAKVAWYCSTCVKYTSTAKLLVDVCSAALANIPCKSPIFQGDFPQYEGPVQDSTRFCFVCGETAIQAIGVKGLKKFGVCVKHGVAFFRRVIEQNTKGEAQYTKPRETIRFLEVNQGQGWISGEEAPYKKMFHEHVREFDERSARKYGTYEDYLEEAGLLPEEGQGPTQSKDSSPVDGNDADTVGGAGEAGGRS